MIDGSTLGPWEQIYTFVHRDGRNIHIHAPRLREHCLRMNYAPVWVPTNAELALSFLHDNIIDPKRVMQLTKRHMREPIILCKTEAYDIDDPLVPKVLLVDGHHRFTRAVADKRQEIRAWLLELHQWQPFSIFNLPNYTVQSLIDEPIIPKPHWGSK